MKKVLLSLALAAVVVFASNQAQAGEPNLSALGLGGMKTMSQSAAKQVRGQGVVVWGNSYASMRVGYGSYASSRDGFYAAGRSVGAGAHFSIAGRPSYGYGYGARRQSYVYAGGAAAAFAR